MTLRKKHAQPLLLLLTFGDDRPLALGRPAGRTVVQPDLVDRQIGRHLQRQRINRATFCPQLHAALQRAFRFRPTQQGLDLGREAGPEWGQGKCQSVRRAGEAIGLKRSNA